jgi:hypothetical protein
MSSGLQKVGRPVLSPAVVQGLVKGAQAEKTGRHPSFILNCATERRRWLLSGIAGSNAGSCCVCIQTDHITRLTGKLRATGHRTGH